MVCSGIENLTNSTILGILQYPTTCFYNFYLLIMVAIFVVFTFSLYFAEKTFSARGDIVSSMGVSAILTIFLATIGSAVGIIQRDTLLTIIAVGMVFIVVWFLKRDR